MLCMAADEFWFHRKRGLPRWERIGHPLDTLTVVVCLGWMLCVQPSRRSVVVYVVLAIFSSLFVTKDEPVHKHYCQAAEHWLHAVLFVLHPVTLASAGLLWPSTRGGHPGVSPWMVQYSGFEHAFILTICALMVTFALYQIAYWNLLWRPPKAHL